MESRNSKVLFHKAGNGKAVKVNLSIPLLKQLGITEKEREVVISYDLENQRIIIVKK
jgi:hypothetical protein